MNNSEIQSYTDWTLTPQTAQKRGYKFMDDIFYDSHTSVLALQDILRLVKEDGFKLGAPKAKDTFDLTVGLYAPLRKENHG